MKKTTREWVKKAESDHVMAVQSSRSPTPLHDGVCFHCQQCSEKYLKALLEELGLPVAKTHDLDDLLTDLRPHHPTLQSLRRGLLFLSNFAVESRYPGKNIIKRQAASALRWKDKVRTEARNLLGIQPPRKRRKKSP
jgi:HEPN domain-containing protein